MSTQFKNTLFIHNKEILSIFETLGTKENDLSYSLGYVLSSSPHLLKVLLKNFSERKITLRNIVIKLQQGPKRDRDEGITDIEIIVNNEYLFLIEAKRGWNLPSLEQLKRYRSRFREFKRSKSMFIILSDCRERYVRSIYKDSLYNVPIKSIAWSDIIDMINEVKSISSHREKFLLNEFNKYLTEVVIMESQESNWVFVVSLAGDTPRWSKIGWRDLVKNKRKYFYPQGKNWPQIAPNYMGFRFDGKLQHIHHVEKYEVVDDVHKYIPEIKKGKLKNFFLLWLGEPFEPRKELPNGNIWSNGRLWCMLDTLFTSKTVKQACEISKKRLKTK